MPYLDDLLDKTVVVLYILGYDLPPLYQHRYDVISGLFIAISSLITTFTIAIFANVVVNSLFHYYRYYCWCFSSPCLLLLPPHPPPPPTTTTAAAAATATKTTMATSSLLLRLRVLRLPLLHAHFVS